jgi:hypothetical protein
VSSFVLRFKGVPTELQAAMKLLQQQIPGIVLTPKTGTLLEAQLDEELISKLQSFDDWDVSRPSYAEIEQPALDLKRMRELLKR